MILLLWKKLLLIPISNSLLRSGFSAPGNILAGGRNENSVGPGKAVEPLQVIGEITGSTVAHIRPGKSYLSPFHMRNRKALCIVPGKGRAGVEVAVVLRRQGGVPDLSALQLQVQLISPGQG